MRKVNSYRCPHCGKKYKSLATWGNHIQSEHPGLKPTDWDDARYFYFYQTGKKEGHCIICGNPTKWNSITMKYERFCPNPMCKETYRNQFKQRMIDKHGKVHLLNDPEQQRKMLLGRKISGEYIFRNGKKVAYTASYEKNFLVFLDRFIHFDPDGIMMPSPHTYEYRYINPDDKDHEGVHFYIPDAYIPSINLEVEIKQSTNMHPKLQKIDAVKTMQKDQMMKNLDGVNYIKILDKDYSNFIQLLQDLQTGEIVMESISEIVQYDPMYKKDGKRLLSEFKRATLDAMMVASYRKECHPLADVLNAPSILGEIIIDDGKVVGFYNYEKRDNCIWLHNLYISEPYRKNTLGTQLLRRAVRFGKITNLAIPVENEIMIRIAQKQGFQIYNLGSSILFLSNE